MAKQKDFFLQNKEFQRILQCHNLTIKSRTLIQKVLREDQKKRQVDPLSVGYFVGEKVTVLKINTEKIVPHKT